MAQSLKLIKHVGIKGLLVCKTGTRIGGTESGIGIGSAESPVIKDARGTPFIPGSSLKGKMRSMLEYKYKKVGDNGSPCGCGQNITTCPVCTIFGPHKNTRHELGPTRIIVRDAFLSEKSQKDWKLASDEGKEFTEVRKQTSIDRRTGTALRGSLRELENVPAGTEFDLNVSVRIFEGDDEKRIKEIIQEGMSLINKDYLGGSGTRGYGWVEIKDIEVTDC